MNLCRRNAAVCDLESVYKILTKYICHFAEKWYRIEKYENAYLKGYERCLAM